MILAGMNYVSSCQSTTTDTICAPTRVWKNLLTIAKQKEVQDSIVILYQNDINILQGQVNLLGEKDRNNSGIQAACQSQVDILNKELKKEKNKVKLTGIAGLALTAIVAGLFLFK
jgi:hypothetical protein